MKLKEEITREKIINSALRIFAKEGFFKATVDHIAQATGLAKGTLYLYFKDKASLYVSVIEEHFKVGIEYLHKVEKESTTSTEKLKKIADEWIDTMIRLKSSFFMFSMENINLSSKMMKAVKPIMNVRLKEMIAIISRIIEHGIAKKEFRKIQPRLAALHYLNTIRTGFFVSFIICEKQVNKNELLELFFDGLKKRR
jgi:TetR/AcrR family fatty acid metabolism transcriptional regulator